MAISLELLRHRHPEFVYDSFEWHLEGQTLTAEFKYRLTIAPELSELDTPVMLATTLQFMNLDAERFQKLDHNLIEKWLFSIGMVEGFSYWKLSCSPLFRVAAGELSPEQIPFWDELLRKGLSEFFFVNKIDGWQKDFVQFVPQVSKKGYATASSSEERDKAQHTEQVLIPVGGGKDSVVSVELLKTTGVPVTTFTLNKNPQVEQVLQLGKIAQNIEVIRQLDPQLKQLNATGYLNGHTPFSAMLAFVSTFAAYLHDFKYVALSNEFSANEGNTTFFGQNINHQYSKTLEFEANFRTYLKTYLSESIEYFSFLRPLHELQIAGIFAGFSEYLPVFLSCNRGQKTGKWCGECPKCVFVFAMLSPFVDAKKLEEVFGKNIFADASLLPILEELTGLRECKSLECVGTREETTIALFLAKQKYLQEMSEADLPILLREISYTLLHQNDIDLSVEHMQHFLHDMQQTHFVPTPFFGVLQEKVSQL